MMNVQQISSQLAMMPDQALQKYAMMHKDDPYIMALAVSESRRRKEMRAAGQSAQAQPQAAQPKVAEQALMEMAPSAGVAALPTQEMDFAGGGIVAFADGGDVERYQAGGTMYETPYDRMTRLNRERAERERQERLAQIAAAGGDTSSYGEQMGALGSAIDRMIPDPRDIFKTLVSAPGYGLNKDAAPAPSALAAATPYDPSTATRADQYRAAPQAAPGTGTATAGLGATPEAAAMRKMQAPVAAPSVAGAKDLAGQFLDTKAMRADLGKYQADEKAAVEAARARREEGKPAGTAYSKFEESLQAEEAGAAKEKDEATGVAIFKAGLAMMAGTSPRAFENIGKGALAGLEEYSGAMKDMKKAAKERQKAFADIEQARRAEARDDWKSKAEFEDKAETRLAKAREFGVKGIMDITGKDAEIAASIYKTQVTEAGATQRANAQTAALMSRTGNTEEKQQLSELKSLQKQYTDQMKTTFNKGERQVLQAKLDRVEAAIAQMAGLGTMGVAPGAASPGGNTRMRFDAQGNPIQ